MPNSLPSDFPEKFLPGTKPATSALNILIEAVKIAANNKSQEGLESNSSSSGNSVAVEQRHLRPPIWAMLTNKHIIYFNSLDTSYRAPEYEGNTIHGCYGFWRCSSGDTSIPYDQGGCVWVDFFQPVMAFSWVELTEDFDINRKIGTVPISQIFSNPDIPLRIPEPWEVGGPSCTAIPSQTYYPTVNHGTLKHNPAFCINNSDAYDLEPGKIVHLYYGAGDYMLFNNAWNTSGGIFAASGFYQRFRDNEQPYIPGEDHP